MKTLSFSVLGIYALAQSIVAGSLLSVNQLTENDCAIVSEGFCIPKKYNKNQRPNSSEPTNVYVKFGVEQITSVNDDEFTISLGMELHLYWKDERLKYIGNDSYKDVFSRYSSKNIPLGMEWTHEVWLPDINVRKMKSIRKPKILQEFGSKLLETLFITLVN